MNNCWDTEYGQLIWYEENRDDEFLSKFYLAISDTIKNDLTGYMDLSSVKNDMILDFEFFKLQKRYNVLWAAANQKLDITKDGFFLDGHLFQTLKEVAKAIKNKAFL